MIDTKLISIIIVTKDRFEDLKKTIEHTIRTDFLGYSNYELIVVDSSKDEIARNIADLVKGIKKCSNVPITYIYQKANMPAARNIGIRYAKGEIVLFIDDDLFLQKMALSYIIFDFVAFKDAGVVGGRVFETIVGHSLLGTWGKPGVRINPFGLITLNFLGGDSAVEVMGVKGCCMSFRKSALLKVGGFDEEYGGTSNSEEGDVQAKITKIGYTIIYDPHVVSFHALTQVTRPNLIFKVESYHENFTYFWFKNYLFSRIDYTLSGTIFIICLLLKSILSALLQKNPLTIIYAIRGMLRGMSKYKIYVSLSK